MKKPIWSAIAIIGMLISNIGFSEEKSAEQGMLNFSSFKEKLYLATSTTEGTPIQFPTVKAPAKHRVLLSDLIIEPHVIDKWKIQLSTEIFWVTQGVISSVYLLSDGRFEVRDFGPGHLYINNPNVIDFAFNKTDKTVIVHTLRLGGNNKEWIRAISTLPNPNEIVSHLDKYKHSAPDKKLSQIYFKEGGI